jgi:hypothetical protein
VYAQPSHEIDVELFTFVERYATNLARWDLLIYFGDHPSVRHTTANIAEKVGRGARSLQKELDDLVYQGILRAHYNSEGASYELVHSPTTRRAVTRLARSITVNA